MTTTSCLASARPQLAGGLLATALTALLAAAGLLAPAGTALAGPASSDRRVAAWRAAGDDAGATQRVIVRARGGAVGPMSERLVAKGRRPHTRQPALDMLAVTVDRADLDALLADPDVLGVSLDLPVASAGKKSAPSATTSTTSAKPSTTTTSTPTASATPTPSSSTTAPIWLPSHLATTLGVDALVLNGRPIVGWNVGVAVIDSGIANTGDYLITKFVDFVNGRTDGPYDDFGHGTHVAGLVASNGVRSNGVYRGVAPGARLIGLKVLDATGSGLTSTVLAALDYAILNKTTLGIDVINLSLGHVIDEPAATDPLVQAVERATAAGLVVVVSAGNVGTNPDTGVTGYAGISSPGNAPSALTVGALDTKQTLTRTDDEVTSYSSRGPTWYDGVAKPDLVAPGHRLTSDATATSTLAVDPRRAVHDHEHRPELAALPRCQQRLPAAERHQHGHRGDQRGGGPADRRASAARSPRPRRSRPTP